MTAWLDIEEHENGFPEALLLQYGFPCWIVHYGCYRLWSPDDLPEDAELLFAAVIQFLQESHSRLQALRVHLKNPMRLLLRFNRKLRVRGSSASSSMKLPVELVRLAGALGMCIELDAVFEFVPSHTSNSAEPNHCT
jgi:hypothetical protein